MEAKWLEDFLSLADTKSFSRAARHRHLTQSAFSRRIAALESGSRSKTLAWIVFDRYLERSDFADEEDARANIGDWLERLAAPGSGASAQMTKVNGVAAGAVAAGASTASNASTSSTTSTAEMVGETVIDIVGDLDWIEMVAEWFFN